jgi:hypothetical protein
MIEQTPTTVRLAISEPWELGERTLTGAIVNEHAGVSYSSLLVSPRHEGHPLSRVAAGEAVRCNAFGIAGPTAANYDLMGVPSWRGGGLVLIGTLSSA